MEVWLGIVFTVILGVIIILVLRNPEHVDFGELRKAEEQYYNSQKTSQQTRQRGTPEQERGSDDTG